MRFLMILVSAMAVPGGAAGQTGAARDGVVAGAEAAPLAGADEAIANGVERLCAWFVRGKDYSLPAAQAVAGKSGFAKGAGVRIVPFPETTGSYSSLGFHAEIKEPAGANDGVAAFMAFHPTACQVQVYGHKDEAERYLASLPSRGWTLTERKTSTTVTAERWLGRQGDAQVTLVANRWTGTKPAPANLGFILNVLPGDNPTMGAFLPE